MSALQIFLFLLFLFIVIICILIICWPQGRRGRCRGRKKCPPIIDDKSRCFAAEVLRSQTDSTILPQIDIPADAPLTVPFNRPHDVTVIHVTQSGDYDVSYSLQLAWSQESSIETAVHTEVDSKEDDVVGSQQFTHNVIASTQVLSHTFRAHFKKGTRVSLRIQASDAGSVSIPASTKAQLLLPSTLASLCIS